MNWYLQNGKESDVIFSSRVRLSRNIKGIRVWIKIYPTEGYR